MTYPTIGPFRSSGGGGSHVKTTERGSVGIATKFPGELLGAVQSETPATKLMCLHVHKVNLSYSIGSQVHQGLIQKIKGEVAKAVCEARCEISG